LTPGTVFPLVVKVAVRAYVVALAGNGVIRGLEKVISNENRILWMRLVLLGSS
jgi:hypothetical protein